MSTVIDSLVVLLSLDPKGFTQGQKDAMASLKKTDEAAKKHTSNIEYNAGKMGAAFKSAGFSMLGVLGIAVSFGQAASQFKQFVVGVTNADAATGRAAKNMGVMTKELSAWQKLSSKFGSSSEDITSAFQNTSKIASELQWGGSAASGPLGMLLGNRLAEFTQMGQAGDVNSMMKMLQGAVANSSDPRSALKWMREAGYSDSTITMMREIGNDLERNLDLQLRANVASERDAELAIKRQAAWDRFGDAIERIGKLIVNSPLLNLVEKLDSLTSKLQKYTDNPAAMGDDAAGAMGWGGFGIIPKKLWQWFGPKASPNASPSAPGVTLPGSMYGKESGLKGTWIQGPKWNAAADARDAQADNLAQLQAELRRGGHAPRERAVLQAEFDRLTSLARQGAGSPGSAGGGMTVHVDKIEVQTQATDARGIAESLRSEMQREQRVFSAHGNVGQR